MQRRKCPHILLLSGDLAIGSYDINFSWCRILRHFCAQFLNFNSPTQTLDHVSPETARVMMTAQSFY